jgi:glutamate--cysteine ligase
VAKPLGIGFLGIGMTPNWTRADMPKMPKGRYKIMTAYMPKVGKYGLDMMYRTCTVQANLDFANEADMVKKLRVSLALQPVATALFANSPFTEGKPNGFLSFRSEIWRDTDNQRAGMLPWAFEDGMGFERWTDYALDVPMYFVKRGDKYIDVSGKSFLDFFAGKLPQLPGERPTISDWANSKCGEPTEARGDGCLRSQRIGLGCSTTMKRSMPVGTWSSRGRQRKGKNCEMMCRDWDSRRKFATAMCSRWRRKH